MSGSAREQAKEYLSSHMIPQMFESLLACLMMERPVDPINFIEGKMRHIREIGLKNVNWETFVFHLHPYRDPLRNKLIQDGSKFDSEREENRKAKLNELNEEALEEGDQEEDEYKSELFRLTES